MNLTELQDSEWMRRAIDIARGGWGQTRPNPMVGAVLVADGEVVGEGFHSRYGEAHAEVEAIRQANDRARGATLYVTLEPCVHDGKTPSCCRMILDAGIRRVVYANADPHPEAGGGAVELAGSGLELTGGVLAGEAARLNSAFLWWHWRRDSFVALKLAVSLDGKIAEREGVRTDLTGAEARRKVMQLRAAHDAILVGAGTVRVDDPVLTVRGIPSPRVAPLRVVLDSAARVSPASRLVATVAEAPVLVLVSGDADPARISVLRECGVEVQAIEWCPGSGLSLPAALDALKERGCTAILCEGGATLASSLLSGGHVQRVHWFVAPRVIGPGGVDALARQVPDTGSWRLADCSGVGDDALIEWDHTELESITREI